MSVHRMLATEPTAVNDIACSTTAQSTQERKAVGEERRREVERGEERRALGRGTEEEERKMSAAARAA